MTEQFSYDRVVYPSFVFPQTSPQRLATKAHFHGLAPADPKKCRYLDLGCGDGANLLLHAFDFPDSEFVGIDLSTPRIEEGKANIKELGLDNVTLIAGDVTEYGREQLGEFDYIVAHGLYSWVPEYVREAARAIYGTCLSENGIGYISYNAYPGCHMRETLWHMMKYHVAAIEDPKEQVSNALGFLNAVQEATPNPVLKELMGLTVKDLMERPLGNIFHDDLSFFNRPFYFYEFQRDITDHALQFVCEIEVLNVSTIKVMPGAARLADALAQDLTEREQYLDFSMMTTFRSSVICREAQQVEHGPGREILNDFYFYSDVKRMEGRGDIHVFSVTQGGTIDVKGNAVAAALGALGDIHPSSLSFQELTAAAGLDKNSIMYAEFANQILSMANAGIIRFQLLRPEFATAAGEFPTASKFARWQAAKGFNSLTTLAGFNYAVEDPGMLELVKRLDGTRDRAALAREMIELYEVPDEERAEFEAEMPANIETQLKELAAAAFLTA